MIGYLAAICMAMAQFPQAMMVFRTRSTEGVSLFLSGLLTLGVIFWLVYGILSGVDAMFTVYVICLLPSLYILYVGVRNRTRMKSA